MRNILFLLLLAVSLQAADLVCESGGSNGGTYAFSNSAAWICYGQAHTVVASEYPGKNFPTNNYIAVIGVSTNSSLVTEHIMNVNTTLGVRGKNYAKWTVSGAADNGSGLIRVTTATNTVATGDKVFCYGFNGTNGNQAYGIWTATSIDTTHIDLQSSTYSGIAGVTTGSCEFPAALKRQGYSAASTTVGKWAINANIAATFRGDVIDTWTFTTRLDETFAMVRCGDDTAGGCDWIWDSGGAAKYRTNIGVAAAMRNMRFFFRGTSVNHATVSTNASGSNMGYFWMANAVAGGDIFANYTDFTNIGDATNAAWTLTSEASSMFSLNHVTISNCNYFLFQTSGVGIDSAAGGTFLISNTRILTTPLNTTIGAFDNYKPPAGKTLTIGPGVSFLGPTAATSATNATNIIYDRCIFDGPPKNLATVNGGRAGTVVTDSLFVKGTDRATDNPYSETLTNNYMWVDHDAAGPNNPHHYSPPTGDAFNIKQVWDGNVFDQNSNFNDGSGDILNEAGIAQTNPVLVTIMNNLILPASNYDGNVSTAWNASTNMDTTCGANVTFLFHHNTIFATTDDHGAVMFLGHLCAEVTGKVIGFYCNAAVQSISEHGISGGNGVFWTESLVTTTASDVVTPANVKYNALFNWQVQSNAGYSSANGTRYAYKASTAPGTGDQNFDTRLPFVVDRTRRLRTWVNHKYAQSFTLDTDAIAYMRADTTRAMDIPDLVTWVKAGWTVNEPTLNGACYDGSDIGMAVAATGSGTCGAFPGSLTSGCTKHIAENNQNTSEQDTTTLGFAPLF